jgi:hypothetical protein
MLVTFLILREALRVVFCAFQKNESIIGRSGLSVHPPSCFIFENTELTSMKFHIGDIHKNYLLIKLSLLNRLLRFISLGSLEPLLLTQLSLT